MDAEAVRVFFDRDLETVVVDPRWKAAHAELIDLLETGRVRAAERGADGSWRTNSWVKKGILSGFRNTALMAMEGPPPGIDKAAYPPRRFGVDDGVRLVPGGSAVRRGAFVSPGVVVMPPAYVNVGAYVGAGTMVDSHALVGSCAQIGERVHLSAAAQVGGVLGPAGARPVVIEDEVFVGGLVGVFEGVLVRRRAVLAAGVLLTGSTTIYDLVHACERQGEIPEGAVVVPGSRPARGDYAQAAGITLGAAVIVKYRDARTDAATALEGALR